MITVEKKPAIAPEVSADLGAVCNRDGIVRDPILLRRRSKDMHHNPQHPAVEQYHKP